MDPTAVDLLQFVPTPGQMAIRFQTVPIQPDRADQFTVKFDHRINDKQNLSVYYYFNDHHDSSPLPTSRRPAPTSPASAPHVPSASSNGTSQPHLDDQQQHGQRVPLQLQPRGATHLPASRSTPTWCRIPVRRRQLAYQRARHRALLLAMAPPANALGIHPGLGPSTKGVPFIQLLAGSPLATTSKANCPR